MVLYWSLVQALLVVGLLSCIDCNKNDDGEPHTYTISFFQFDPKDIGAGGGDSHIKRKSKKDIKPSDLSLLQQLGNETGVSNTTSMNGTDGVASKSNVTNPTTDSPSKSSIEQQYDPENHKHRNKTEDSSSKNKSASSDEVNDFQRNGTIVENKTSSQEIDKDQNSLKLNTTNKKTDDIKSNSKVITNDSLKNSSSLNSSNMTHDESISKNTTSAEQRSKIRKPHHHTDASHHGSSHKKDVLNPNPSPSVTDAALHLQSPHFQGKPLNKKPVELSLFEKNDTKSVKSDDVATLTEKSLALTKKGEAKENSTKPERKPFDANKDAKNQSQSVVVSKVEGDKTSNSTGAPKNETAEKALKLEKDKKINKQIQENAKQIKPIKNTFDHAGNIKDTHFSVKAFKKQMAKHQNPTKAAIKTIEDDDEAKDQITRHRELVSHFVPSFKVNARDKTLGFQLGSLKHPKHELYPQCHHCPANSTYASCVRKSTLKKCKHGLNNICFTKSQRRHGITTYQMGCADHKKCSSARAFPCRDGSPKCFTCCQFDRCNSSPHNGDYELDELNMAELELDSNNGNMLDAGNWYWQLILVIANIILLKAIA